MTRTSLLTRVLGGVAIYLCSVTLSAGTYLGPGKVDKVFTDSNNYGGCMAYITFDPAFANTGCDNFVSFGCDGQYVSKTQANTNFSLAQLALVTNVTVNIFADTTKTYNTGPGTGPYCLADRIDVAAQ